MIAPERDGESPSSSVALNLRSDFSVDFADEPGTFDDSDRGVLLYGKLLELVMASELDFPAEACDLINQPCFDEVDRACVDSRTRLIVVKEGNALGTTSLDVLGLPRAA